MDLLCRVCGEPWGNDEFHYIAEEQEATYGEVVRDFESRGCIAIYGYAPASCVKSKEQEVINKLELVGLVGDLMGDDYDGAAAMIDDIA